MPSVTFEYAGRKIHLVREMGECERCDNRAQHVRLDPRGLSSIDITRALVNGYQHADVRLMLAGAGDLHDFHRTVDRTVVERLDWLVRSGRLIAIECRLPLLPYIVEEPPAPVDMPRPARTPSQATDPEKTWVEVKLVDDKGKPVPGQKYRIKTPDGVVHEGTLDEQGTAMLSGLDPGGCDISFPDIDGNEWKPA
jgi:hypothetical protein